VLYIGVRDNGEIETPQQNLDEVQKKFNRRLESVYPPIAYIPQIIAESGRQALAVIIPGSELCSLQLGNGLRLDVRNAPMRSRIMLRRL
jgi:hypothetical protein